MYVEVYDMKLALTIDSKIASDEKVIVKKIRVINGELIFHSDFRKEQFYLINHKGIEYYVTTNKTWFHNSYDCFYDLKKEIRLIIYEKNALENLICKSSMEYGSLIWSKKIHRGNLLPKNNYQEIVSDLKLGFECIGEFPRVRQR